MVKTICNDCKSETLAKESRSPESPPMVTPMPKITIFTVTVLLLVGAAFGADEQQPLPPADQAQLDKAVESNVSEASKLYDQYLSAIAKAQDKVVKDLERVKLDAMKKGNLPLANAADAKIKEVKEGSLRNEITAKVEQQALNSDLLGYNIPGKPKVTIIPFSAFDQSKLKQVRFKAKAVSTSNETENVNPQSVIDDSLGTEWSLRGPVGSATISLSQPSQASTLYFVTRFSVDDPIWDGLVTINGVHKIPFSNLPTNSVLVVSFPSEITIQKVVFASLSGRNNPGLRELMFGH